MQLAQYEVNLFKALAHPLRLKLLKRLCKNELCVCDLTKEEAFSQSNISQHLRILKDAELVVQRKDGLNVYYRVKDESLIDLIALADKMIKRNIEETAFSD